MLLETVLAWGPCAWLPALSPVIILLFIVPEHPPLPSQHRLPSHARNALVKDAQNNETKARDHVSFAVSDHGISNSWPHARRRQTRRRRRQRRRKRRRQLKRRQRRSVGLFSCLMGWVRLVWRLAIGTGWRRQHNTDCLLLAGDNMGDMGRNQGQPS